MPKDIKNRLSVMGFIIEDNVIYDVRKRKLISTQGAKEMTLRKTQSCVLEYLLKNAVDNFVTDESLMKNVWEKNGLRASTQRVWQVINRLKTKITETGVSDEFILRMSKKGYFIRKESVKILFSCNACFPSVLFRDEVLLHTPDEIFLSSE